MIFHETDAFNFNRFNAMRLWLNVYILKGENLVKFALILAFLKFRIIYLFHHIYSYFYSIIHDS